MRWGSVLILFALSACEKKASDLVQEREAMVRATVQSRGVRDARVLAAMRTVPRHEFVPSASRKFAYSDRPLPIGWGQTISQPYVVAAMTDAARPKSTDRCLEIGTGSGYQAAVLAELCGKVFSIEIVPELARFAKDNLRRSGYGPDRVALVTGDGYGGWPEEAPFQVVVVTAAPPKVPRALLQQLAIGGRLVVPVGRQGDTQTLQRWTRTAKGSEAFVKEDLMDVRFVPMVTAK
ncbi:MAG: protein-L-isoaspartate(D-aspartate) O-methyltransferase [Polyangiaceae bacterium]|nr:protein-L-isoaspartate(D-aspartate) O-methyltransferase [Polyangiaceae bacterium]